jgi:hypothetical protein
MKALSVRFRFVVFGVIVIVAVVSCCNFVVLDTKTFVELGHYLRHDERTYVPWKSQDKFDTALKQLCDHNGTYCLKVKLDNNTIIDRYHPHGSKDCTDCRLENIRTVKVTKSKAADNTAARESAVNDPHATYRVQSPNPGDIIKVLDALEHK